MRSLQINKYLTVVEPPAYVDFFSESRDEQPKYSIANFTGRSNSKRVSSIAPQPSKSEQEAKRLSSQSVHRTSSARLSSSVERESQRLSNGGGDEEIFIEDSAQGVIVPIVTKKSSSQIQSLETSRAMNQSSDDVFHTTERAKVQEKSDVEVPTHNNQKQSLVSRLSRRLSQNIDRSFDHAIEGLIYKIEKGRDPGDVDYSPTKTTTTTRSNSHRRPPSPVKNSSTSGASKSARPTSPYVPGGWPNGEPKMSLSTSAKLISERSGAIQSPSPSYSTGTAIGAKASADNRDPRGSIKMHAPPAMRKPLQQQAMTPQAPPSEEKQVASHDGGEPIICWGKSYHDKSRRREKFTHFIY